MTSTTFFFVFIPLLAIIFLAVNLIFAPHNPYQEKDSAFECGFHSFLGQNRTQFSISFFIFALLFLLFDLEILLVYPYVVSAYANGIYGLVIMLIFFLALTLGFAFELGKNALKIDSKQMLILDSTSTSTVNVISSFKYFSLNYFIKFISKVLVNLLTLYVILTCRNFIWDGNFVSDLCILFNNFDLNTLMLYKEKIFVISCCTVFIREIVTEIYNIIINIFYNILRNVYSVSLFKTIKVFFYISFSDLKLKIGIKSESENLVKIKNVLAKNSDSDSPSKSEDKQPNKGKGRALSTSDSEDESYTKKRKVDKGKAIDLDYSPSNDQKSSLIDRILDLKTSLDEAEKAEKRFIRGIDKSNDINLITKLLEQKEEEEKKINELKTKIFKLTEEGNKTNADFDTMVDNASYVRYKAFRDLNGTPPSTNSSRPVSSSDLAANEEFPPYNPFDYESESENKGESSTKKK
jgi:NADH-ubiquinone oxidoreductase chain 3